MTRSSAAARPIFQLTFTGAGFKQFGYPGDYQGTSMAAAHVSGVAAMTIASRVLGKNPSPAAVECQLERHRAQREPASWASPMTRSCSGRAWSMPPPRSSRAPRAGGC